MTFPSNYPMSPPSFKFLRPIYHPNVYPDGRICISILHPAGEDEMSGESATERWTSVQSVESVLRSILLLLDDPEVSSPANVDAGVLYRNDRGAYIAKASEDVEKSKTDIPEGFVFPTTLVEAPPPKIADDDEFWNESDAEDDFGGSDSSGEDAELNDFDEDEEEDEDGEQEFEDSDEDPAKADEK
jgi:ubiquitin-conjugating enzyme E2 R